MGDDTVFLSDGEMYDLIVETVGDETSLEFCTLVDYYLEDNDLDLAMRANGTDWRTVKPLVDEVETRASDKRSVNSATDHDGGD